MEFTIKEIAELIGGTVQGDENISISNISKIQEGYTGSISFLANEKYEPFLYQTKASAVIVAKEFVPKKAYSTTLILVENPYSAFRVLLEEYQKAMLLAKSGIEPQAYVDGTAKVGQNVYVGNFAYVSAYCQIGDNVKIYPNVFLGEGVRVGANTIIYPGVKIYDNCQVGENCKLHANAVIGSDGFGYDPQKDGSYKAIPQLGSVKIGNYVDIGANTVIDCATMLNDVTEIADGAKLDNLIQVAHNVKIGQNTAIAAQAGISGSVSIGKQCIIAGQVGMVGHIHIADNTRVGAQAGILSQIKEPGQVIIGSPAIPYKDYFRSYSVFKKLPELQRKIHDLEQKLAQLESNSTPTSEK